MPTKVLSASVVPATIIAMVVGASLMLITMIDTTIRGLAYEKALELAQDVSKSLAEHMEMGRVVDKDALAAAFEKERHAGDIIGIFGDLGWFSAEGFGSDARTRDAVAAEAAETGEVQIAEFSRVDAAEDVQKLFRVYIPIPDDNGAALVVVAATIDATLLFERFHNGAVNLAIALSLIFSATLMVLYVAFLYKRHKERQAHKHIQYLSHFDSVSCLLNRAGFNELAADALGSGKYAGRRTAVLYVDIDHFKRINDTMGHHVGDLFIRCVGEGISSCLGAESISGRLGGDEFAVVMGYHDETEVATQIARLRAFVGNGAFENGQAISATLSIGIDFDDGCARPLSERLRRADLALYKAKVDGRDTYRVFAADLEQAAMRRRLIESAILDGLDRGCFAVHYQPLIDANTKRVVGCEALLRLTTESGESIAPSEFIPIAESVGAIKQLGTWCLTRAAETFAAMPNDMFVAVNLSARQFEDGDLPAVIDQVLATTGLKASRLELEVTESLLLDNTALVREQLGAVRDLGVSVALDDFGTGHSSLSELWSFGFDKLKIDRSFVSGLSDDTEGAKAMEILDTIIELGHRIKLVVTAEGIETQEQADILTKLACDQLQGYLYAKPMPASELRRMLFSMSGSRLVA